MNIRNKISIEAMEKDPVKQDVGHFINNYEQFILIELEKEDNGWFVVDPLDVQQGDPEDRAVCAADEAANDDEYVVVAQSEEVAQQIHCAMKKQGRFGGARVRHIITGTLDGVVIICRGAAAAVDASGEIAREAGTLANTVLQAAARATNSAALSKVGHVIEAAGTAVDYVAKNTTGVMHTAANFMESKIADHALRKALKRDPQTMGNFLSFEHEAESLDQVYDEQDSYALVSSAVSRLKDNSDALCTFLKKEICDEESKVEIGAIADQSAEILRLFKNTVNGEGDRAAELEEKINSLEQRYAGDYQKNLRARKVKAFCTAIKIAMVATVVSALIGVAATLVVAWPVVAIAGFAAAGLLLGAVLGERLARRSYKHGINKTQCGLVFNFCASIRDAVKENNTAAAAAAAPAARNSRGNCFGRFSLFCARPANDRVIQSKRPLLNH